MGVKRSPSWRTKEVGAYVGKKGKRKPKDVVSTAEAHLAMPSRSSGFQLASNASMPSGVIPPPSIGSGTGRKPLGQAVYRMSRISMQDDGMGRAQTDRQGARVRPLFAKDAITSLEQHGANLAPRIGRSSVK